MASYVTDLQIFDAADAITNWGELSGHTSGSAPATTTENYYQNGIAVDQATGQATGTNAGVQCDYGSTLSWTSGWVFMAWQKFDAGTNIDSWANGGMRIGIGSSSGNMNYWNALGNDFGNYPSGGWQNTAIDPEVTPDGTPDGSPVSGSYRVFGSLPNMLNKITKGSPHVVDIIRYGRGTITVTGTGGLFADMATANDASTAKWGLFTYSGGSYLWKGQIQFGDGSNSTTFTDSNKSIRLDDTPRVSSSFNKWYSANASNSITLISLSVNGVQTSITGSAPVSRGDFDFILGTHVQNSCTWTDLGNFLYGGNTTIISGTYRRCGSITLASNVSGCKFLSSHATAAVITDSLARVGNAEFLSSGTGYAVDISGTEVISNTTMDWNATSSGYTNTSGNKTLKVNVANGVTLTINNNTGDTIYYDNIGSGSVSIVTGQRTMTFNISPTPSNYEYRIYIVTAAGSLAGATEVQGSESSSSSSQQYTYSYSAGTVIAFQLLDHTFTYKEKIVYFTLPDSNTSQDILLEIDTND